MQFEARSKHVGSHCALRCSPETYLTVEDLENPLLQGLASLGSHKDVDDFQVRAGTKQLLHEHFAQEACGPGDEDGLVAIESCNHGHDSSFSLLEL